MNKNVLIALAIAVVLLLILGLGFYFLSSNNSLSQNQEPTPTPYVDVVATIAPEDLGLSFIARADKKAVKFEIENTADITSIDYEISYVAEGDLARGAIGHVEPKNGVIASNYIDLGTCSSGKCKYDKGVTSVKLLLKITKTDGQVYSSETSLDL